MNFNINNKKFSQKINTCSFINRLECATEVAKFVRKVWLSNVYDYGYDYYCMLILHFLSCTVLSEAIKTTAMKLTSFEMNTTEGMQTTKTTKGMQTTKQMGLQTMKTTKGFVNNENNKRYANNTNRNFVSSQSCKIFPMV